MYDRDGTREKTQPHHHHRILYVDCLFCFPDFGWLLNYSIYTSFFRSKHVRSSQRCAHFEKMCWNQWETESWMSMVGRCCRRRQSIFGILPCSRVSTVAQISLGMNLCFSSRQRKQKITFILRGSTKTYFCVCSICCCCCCSRRCCCRFVFLLHCIAIERTHSETQWPYMHSCDLIPVLHKYTLTHTHSLSVSRCFFFFSRLLLFVPTWIFQCTCTIQCTAYICFMLKRFSISFKIQ